MLNYSFAWKCREILYEGGDLRGVCVEVQFSVEIEFVWKWSFFFVETQLVEK